jgi:hypothetical protein
MAAGGIAGVGALGGAAMFFYKSGTFSGRFGNATMAQNAFNNAQSNPLYQQPHQAHENPLYQPRVSTSV